MTGAADAAGRGYKRRILILGSGRSGTTWLAKLIDAHADVLYRHEPDIAARTDAFPALPAIEDVARYRDAAADYLDEMAAARWLKCAGSPPFFRKSYRGVAGAAARRAMIVRGKLEERLFGLRARVPDMVRAHRRNNVSLLIKSVTSVGRMRLFSQADPALKIIHITRDPRRVVDSHEHGVALGLMRRGDYLPGAFASADVARYPYTEPELRNRPAADQAAYLWMLANDKAALEMESRPNYLHVAYEDLCRDLREELGRIYRFCGLDWKTGTDAFLAKLEAAAAGAAGGAAAAGARNYFSVLRPPAAGRDAPYKALDRARRDAITGIVACARHPAIRAYAEG